MITRNPYQPRKYFEPEAINQLSESIRLYGVLNPLTVRRKNGGFELIAGERRLRAARAAGRGPAPSEPSSVTKVLRRVRKRASAGITGIAGNDRRDGPRVLRHEQFERPRIDLLPSAHGWSRR